MTSKPMLTPHQRNTLGRLVKWHRSLGRPVPLADFGSRGAIAHLAEKGYVRLSYLAGRHGGRHAFAEPDYTMVPTKLAVSTVL